MTKLIKKILISILILLMCISPVFSTNANNSYATSTPTPAPTSTPAPEGITREQVYSDADSQTTGFKYYIHVGNVTYTHYYQVRGFYKDDYIAAWNSTIRSSGCGMTSCSILLSGYGVTLNPRQVLQESGGSFGISRTLANHGVTRVMVWQ